MKRPTLLHLGTSNSRFPADGPFREGLMELADCTIILDAERRSEDEKINLIRTHDVLLNMWGSDQIPEALFPEVGNWKYLLNVGGGCPKVLQIHDHGIKLTNWGDSPAHNVAEGSFALLLNALKDIPAQLNANKRGETHLPKEKYVSGTLYDTKVAIFGMGMIAKKFVQMLKPFDAEIGFYDPYAEDIDESLTRFSSFSELMDWAEILIVHAASTSETRHIINAEQLAKLPDNGIVISTVVGTVFDEEALYKEALSKRLRVGYDVTDYEREDPSPDDPLRSCENITFTWHDISHFRWPSNPNKLVRHEKVCLENLSRFAEGKDLLWEIDRVKHERMT